MVSLYSTLERILAYMLLTRYLTFGPLCTSLILTFRIVLSCLALSCYLSAAVPIQPALIQCVPCPPPGGVNQPPHLRPVTVVKNEWIGTSTSPYAFVMVTGTAALSYVLTSFFGGGRLQQCSCIFVCFGKRLDSCQSRQVAIYLKKKLKCSRYRPGVSHRVGRGMALLFHDRGTRRGVSGQQHAPAAL